MRRAVPNQQTSKKVKENKRSEENPAAKDNKDWRRKML